MNSDELKELVQSIVTRAQGLKDRHTTASNAQVNYACVFSRSVAEYTALTEAVQSMGRVIKQTKTGKLYDVGSLETTAGQLRIVKIRIPDETRPERGDADFTVTNYSSFKEKCLAQAGFTLIERPGMEMLELTEPNGEVRAYFSHPPIDDELLGRPKMVGDDTV